MPASTRGPASGTWYRESGSGMGATLNTAVGMHAYTLADRGTWLSFGNRRDFKILVEGDPRLFNQYGVILVNPEKHSGVKAKEGQAFMDWLVGPEGQAAIASYRLNGERLFFPNARTPKDRTMKPDVHPPTSPSQAGLERRERATPGQPKRSSQRRHHLNQGRGK